ncbi:hemagglutinin repeat-containing protein [Pseudomonas fluorescens]
MDVRQFALLARQPSAALKTRECFLGMPKRGLAFLLANVMFWQPMWAQADGIVVANSNTSLDRAGNGVPIINIATPNGSGLSHNQFHDYNVAAQGVILNNGSTQTTATQLGGHIIGNPNLKNSGSAQAILNEVISGNPSQLRGYTEVAGQSARVIVANPYGITCNGCGFINSPRVTLTTGKPVLDNGRLDRFQVDQGAVAIEGAGLNATNVDRFEIITRSAKINAQLQAQNLTIVAGRNDVNAQTLNATARTDDGSSKPQLAIDSSALGGMYAGAIKLVGTEAGVGVKLDGKLIASGGDIQLDANGQLSLVDTSATGAVNVKAASLDARGPVYAGTALNVQTQGNLTNRQTLAARDSISLSAGGQLTNAGAIEAGVNIDGSRNASGDLSLSAQNLDNTGKSLTASRNLTVNTAQTLNNQGGTLSGQTAVISAGTLDNSGGGKVQSSAHLKLNAGRVNNAHGVILADTLDINALSLNNRDGVVTSDSDLHLTLEQSLDNHSGEVSSAGVSRVDANRVDNTSGLMTGTDKLTLTVKNDLTNHLGVLGAGGGLQINADSLDNSNAGKILSESALDLRVNRVLDNRNNGLISAGNTLQLQAVDVDNRGGSLTGKQRVALTSTTLDNRGARLTAGGDLQLRVDRLDNRQQGLVNAQGALDFQGTLLNNQQGVLGAVGPLYLQVKTLDNAGGRISSSADLTAHADRLSQQSGKLMALGNLSLFGTYLDNQSGGLIGATKALKLNVDVLDNRGGEISAGANIDVSGIQLDNSNQGKVLAGSDLGLQVARVINQAQGLLRGKGALLIKGQHLDNNQGQLLGQQSVNIDLSAELDNTRGKLASAGSLVLNSGAALINQEGVLTSESGVSINSASLDNRAGEISSRANVKLVTGDLDNTLGGRLISNDRLDLVAGQVSNGLDSRIASDNALIASMAGLDQQGGQMFSKHSLSLDLNQGRLNNQGLINAPLLVLKNLATVDNHAGEISSAQGFTLNAASLDNSNGKLISNQALTFRIEQALVNAKGLISASALNQHSASLDNSDGLLSSRGELNVDVDDEFVNRNGSVVGDGHTRLTAQQFNNDNGKVSSKGDLTGRFIGVSNQSGSLTAMGMLKLDAGTLHNQKAGLLGGVAGGVLNIGALDNRGGEITSNGSLELTGQTLDNSDSGQISASGWLHLTVDEVLNRNRGHMSAQTGLSLLGTTLTNTGGSLSSQQNLDVQVLGNLDNGQGELSSEGLLTVSAASLSNRLGILTSARNLAVSTTLGLDNQAGEIVTDGALKLQAGRVDNSHDGTLSSKAAMVIGTGDFNNSNAGNVSSTSTLEIRAEQLSNNAGGRITSSGDLNVNASGLDQQGGKLFSEASVTLDLNGGQLDNRSGLINGPLLMLKNLKAVDNRDGEISSVQGFSLNAESLDNDNGKILSQQGLILRIEQVLNNAKGLIAAQSLSGHAAMLDNEGGTFSSRSDLTLGVDGLLINRSKGLITADGNLTLTSNGLDNQQGTLLGTAIGIDLGSVAADLNNAAGLITTTGKLSIKHLRDLNNQGGEISSSQNLQLGARVLDNGSGKLISSDTLQLTADSLINQGGLLSGWRGLGVAADDLDNRNNGTLSSRDGNVDVQVANALLNSAGGALVSHQALTVAANTLDNRDKGIVSSGAGQVLTLGAALRNGQGGLINSATTLSLQSQALDNVGGTIGAGGAIDITTATLDNTSGTLIGKDALTLSLLGVLTNTQGKLASAGDLLIRGASQVDNQGGQLASQNLLTLLTGGLDNRNRGTVAAAQALDIRADGGVQNGDGGLIYSQKAGLQLKAASLENADGAVQSEKGLVLDVSGNLDNQRGKIIAQSGDVTLGATSLDNRGGTLASLAGTLEVQTTGALRNGYDLSQNRQGGIIQAQRLSFTSASLDNNGGRVSAQNNDISITTGNFDNRNGGLYGQGAIRISANDFLNTGDIPGQVAGRQVDFSLTGALDNRLGVIESDGQLKVSAASLNNQGGQLRALGKAGKTEFQIGGLFDNRNGRLETANYDLTLNAGNFQNAGGHVLHAGTGTFDISMANLTQAGGDLLTRGGLTLAADSWTNSGVIQAGRLTVNVNTLNQTAGGQLLASDSFIGSGGNWNNDGLIASDGSLGLTLGGVYSGNGRASSKGTFALGAGQVNLTTTASLAGGDATTLNVGGVLGNQGRISSAGGLTINAGGVNNYGTVASNQNLRLNAGNVLNDHGLLFSGTAMSLLTNDLVNKYGDVYSMDNLTVARDDAGNWANRLENISGNIQSSGDMLLRASTLENRKDFFKVTSQLTSGAIGLRQTGNQSGHMVLMENYETKVEADSAAANISAGRNLDIAGGNLTNSASVITAGANLNANLSNFTNAGATLGTYSTLKSFALPEVRKDKAIIQLWRSFMEYNAVNDPSYKGPVGKQLAAFRSWDVNWNESVVTPRVSVATGGSQHTNIYFGWKHYTSSSGPEQFRNYSPAPAYNKANPAPLPAAVQNVAFFDTKTITGPGVAGDATAVVQAGGSLTINATKNLTNSVERAGQPVSLKNGRTYESTLPGAPSVTVINVQSHLPPDLAQQQVNPLTLSGFTLPQGQNGLFRLSGQTSTVAGNTGPDLRMGSATISVGKHEQGFPARPATAIKAVDAASTAASSLTIARVGQGFDVDAAASKLSAAMTDNSVTQTAIPKRSMTAADSPFSAQNLTRVQGLPDTSVRSNPHKYLIETNPVLTDLKQFMSSDYLLANLGYDPDISAKRLGDGLYEQRLIQQAVVARTGQRFIDGQTSDEKLFKYLMDNAIKSKDQLNLALGVSLSAEQVTALTHDIVWLEKHEVNGESVLVPVLYLAQANNRLAPNGALIAGNDINLIAGQDLNNVGTLRATNNLSATAGNNLVNSGLIEAGNRLDLLATNDLINAAGGIISGRDVSITATQGDLINERNVIQSQTTFGGTTLQRSYLDTAARIEAANNLSLTAGRDVSNLGSEIKSIGDTTIKAGRDVNITALEQHDGLSIGSHSRTSTVVQNGAVVDVGGNLKVNAGRDITAIASQIAAQRDITMAATGDLTLSSAANEQHTYNKSKKVTTSTDRITQVSTTVQSGGNVSLSAGNDMEIVASRIEGAGDVDIDAGRDLLVTSAKDEDASSYLKKSKGSSGRRKTTQKESYDSTNVASVIEAGRNLTVNASLSDKGGVSLEGGHDVTVIGSQLKAGNNLVLGAMNDISVLSATDEHSDFSKTAKKGSFGLSKSGKTTVNSSTTQIASELEAGNDIVVASGKDFLLQASTAAAGNDVEFRSGLVDDTGDINLISANDTDYSRSEAYKKKTGLSVSGGFLSLSSAKEAGRQGQGSTSVGSMVVAGRDTILSAERDINVLGSGIDAGRHVNMDAGRDVNVMAASDERAEQAWSKSKRAGIGISSDDNGVSFFAGAEGLKEKNRLEQKTGAASQISAGQDLAINAKRDINQIGSDLQANNDIDLNAGRNINIDAGRETLLVEQQRENERNGLGVRIDHNYGQTKDAVNGAGKGEDNVSKGSSTLKAVDGISQFLNGPTADVKFGNSKQSSSQQTFEQSSRSSTLNAGQDLNLNAKNDVTVKGAKFLAGRDINVVGRDVTFDVAKGSVNQDSTQRESWGGIHGGTSGGFKIGIGGSYGIATEDGSHGTSTPTQLGAGRDVNLQADHDLNLIGTQVSAKRDIELNAVNDLNIRSAQNDSSSDSNRHNGGGEVGLVFGSEGVGVYASVSMGKGDLEREGNRQQEAYLYAGDKLGFTSGKDTNIAGATLRGDEVNGRVGGDLNVSSVADTGKVKGKEFDISVTATFGPGAGVSGSVGYGQTTGKTNWIEQQTTITGKNKVDIRTENHTQLDGALIAADNGNLKLDTGTLGFSDIAGSDKEHGYYLNVGGSYTKGKGTGAQDASQTGKGKEGETGWSVSGWKYDKDREQIVRATVGAGDIVVRQDAETGKDSTVGLNRDVDKGFEITKDKESRTDLYVSKSSLEAVADPSGTLLAWANKIENYADATQGSFEAALSLITGPVNMVGQAWNNLQAQRVSLDEVPASAREKFGDELALNIAKNFVRNGMDAGAINDLQKEDIAAIQKYVKVFAEFTRQQGCTNSGDCGAEGDNPTNSQADKPSDNDRKGLPSWAKDLNPTTPGGKLLAETERLQGFMDKLPKEQAQLLALSIQAAMGPAKMAIGLAGNVLIAKLFGDKIDAAKDAVSKAIASKLSGEDKDHLETSDNTFKYMFALGETKQQGDIYVRGATTLLNIALGTAANMAGAVTGKVFNVAGTKGVIKASETIGQPVEAVIGGRKRLLRVDIEPNGKLQIQSGGGKDSIVDFRPDLSKPLAPQINAAFKRLPKSARDQLIRNAEKGLKRLQETGNM